MLIRNSNAVESLVGDSRGRAVHIKHVPNNGSVEITTNYVSPLHEALPDAGIPQLTVAETDVGNITYTLPASQFRKVRECMQHFKHPAEHEFLMETIDSFGARLELQQKARGFGKA